MYSSHIIAGHHII